MKSIKSYLGIVFFILGFIPSLTIHSQELDFLIEEALASNPEIEKITLQYSIASEKINELNTVPKTEFSVGYFVSEPETRTGAQKFRVSAKQMLPWFGTITSRQNYAGSLAEAKFEDIVIAKRKLITSISNTYYNLYANQAKQKVIAENIKLLKTYETLALSSLEAGKSAAVDVLKLQMRQNELQQIKDVLNQQWEAEQTNLNKLLNRPNDVLVDVVSELGLPSEDFEVNTDKLNLHPELLKYDKLYHSVEKAEMVNQKESSPMIGFGLDYINVEERTDMDFSDNGKDVLMPMISVSIPIFKKNYKSVTKQNVLQQEEILAEKQERLNTLESLLANSIYERNAARISYQTQNKNIEQAKNAQEILMSSYESGTIDFKDVLDIQELQLKFQMAQIEAIKNYYTQTMNINYLTN